MVLRNMVEGVDLVEAEAVLVVVDSGEVVAVEVIGEVAVAAEVIREVAIAEVIGIGEVAVVAIEEEEVEGVAEEILKVVLTIEGHGVGMIREIPMKAVDPTDLGNHGVTEKVKGRVVAADLGGAEVVSINRDHSIMHRNKIKKLRLIIDNESYL